MRVLSSHASFQPFILSSHSCQTILRLVFPYPLSLAKKESIILPFNPRTAVGNVASNVKPLRITALSCSESNNDKNYNVSYEPRVIAVRSDNDFQSLKR
jgi:hypothetical protein